MKRFFKKIKNFLLNTLFPIRCLNCGTYGNWLCPACQNELVPENKNATVYNLDKGDLKDIFIAGNYDQNKILALTIKQFKYRGLKELSHLLGFFLSSFWILKLTETKLQNILLIPIPLSPKRLRERGFNQSEELGKYLAQKFSYEICDCLKRKNGRRHQADMQKRKRSEKIKGAFYLTEKKDSDLDLKSKSLLLIDDIVTSGATLREAATALKAAGAEKIYALVLAKG